MNSYTVWNIGETGDINTLNRTRALFSLRQHTTQMYNNYRKLKTVLSQSCCILAFILIADNHHGTQLIIISQQNKSIKNFRILLSRRSGPRFSNLCYLNLFLPRFKLRSTQEEKTVIAKLGESQLCNLDFCRILIDTRSVTAKVTTIFHDLLLLDSVDIYYMFWV